ncbi:MAG: site-2 protease family protein [Candidatus Marinimicrobia bacterium]|jgi:Zn-dependent protease|nr:site-2 protease family protein [Candidatus Neomarinimicrobiota bacterium]MBT3676186.1 site-2 protease family protein [Candidatus Neomarinimicrobiota bacterium]MBT3762776.1 site-2 protease family protein [Candidatus Neomarinimicrobiota bacterium]MBT4067452.1 site-2 protease family protein [Candidatus Neomarinimicrobiota bacterium]MBT4270904.1 site-2 protease family protein [Candidatus Neomarinimicrobiota bacterium]
MLFRLPPEVLIMLIPVLLFALVFHEFSHGWVANKLGDPTAKYAGRLTLNPMAHLDMFGTLMILFVGFGWAKPVPVDSRYLANPRTDMMKIAFAGPAANLLLAFVGGTLIRMTGYMGSFTSMLMMFTQINIMLAVFNMIPIPPLDGSQIFSGLMIRKNPNLVYKLQTFGPQILMGLILFGMFTNISPIWMVMSPFVNFFMFLFAGM